MIEQLRRIPIMTALFFALYVAISCATFIHSAHGFASIEGGYFWRGALSASAVDVGMVLSASKLRKTRNAWLVLGLIASAGASMYTQLLFAVTHTAAVAIAPGAEWMNNTAIKLVNVRVIVLPALLPLLAVVYAFASKQGESKEPELREAVNEILALGLNKSETAERMWQLSDNGYGAFTAPYVAELAQCGLRTAQQAKPE